MSPAELYFMIAWLHTQVDWEHLQKMPARKAFELWRSR